MDNEKTYPTGHFDGVTHDYVCGCGARIELMQSLHTTSVGMGVMVRTIGLRFSPYGESYYVPDG